MAVDVVRVRLGLRRIRVLEVLVDAPAVLRVRVESSESRPRRPYCGFKCRRVHDTREREVRDSGGVGPSCDVGNLEVNRDLFGEGRNDFVAWSYDDMDPWRLAFATGVSRRRITVVGETVMDNGELTRVDAVGIRAKAAEAAQRLFARLENLK